MAEEFSVDASVFNIDVLTVQKYEYQMRESMGNAMSQLQRSHAHVVVFMVFGEDLEMMADAADAEGLIGEGHIWINGMSFQSPAPFVSASSNPQRLHALLQGWMDVTDAPLHGDLGVRFRSVFAAAPPAQLAHPILEAFAGRIDTAGVPDVCGNIYDASWVVALGIAHALRADGELDQDEVLARIRSLDFQASTGRVAFHGNGNRDEADMFFLIKSWVPTTEGGEPTVVPVNVATFSFQPGAMGALIPLADPTWPGGAIGWAHARTFSLDCAPGSARGPTEPHCQPCRPGTFAPDPGMAQCAPPPCPTFPECARHPSSQWRAAGQDREGGKLSESTWRRRCLPCSSTGYASEWGQTACTPCPGNLEMPGQPGPSVSVDECVCKEGYLLGCTMRIWQVYHCCRCNIHICYVLAVSWASRLLDSSRTVATSQLWRVC